MNLYNFPIKKITRIAIGNDKYNYINTEGELVSPLKWFKFCGEWVEKLNIGVVMDENYKRNIINQYGVCLSSQWFDSLNYFVNGVAIVRIGTKYNYLRPNGQLMFPKCWFQTCYVWDTKNDLGTVKTFDNKFNLVKPNGEFLLPFDVNWIGSFHEGYARIYVENKGYTYINKHGEIHPKWYKGAFDFVKGKALINVDDFISQLTLEHGKILDSHTPFVSK